MYIKLLKYYQIEYYLYCLNFTKYCVFNVSADRVLPYKNSFSKSNLPVKCPSIKNTNKGYNFNLVYFQYFKNFYKFFLLNYNNSFFIKMDKNLLMNHQLNKFLVDIVKKPSFILVLKPIISIFKILNYKKCQH